MKKYIHLIHSLLSFFQHILQTRNNNSKKKEKERKQNRKRRRGGRPHGLELEVFFPCVRLDLEELPRGAPLAGLAAGPQPWPSEVSQSEKLRAVALRRPPQSHGHFGVVLLQLRKKSSLLAWKRLPSTFLRPSRCGAPFPPPSIRLSHRHKDPGE